jgi:hypothetical protein
MARGNALAEAPKYRRAPASTKLAPYVEGMPW